MIFPDLCYSGGDESVHALDGGLALRGTSRVAKVIQAAPALRDCLATAKRLSHIELGPQENALCHLQYVLLHLQYVYLGNPPSSELESATQRSRVEVTCVACKALAK